MFNDCRVRPQESPAGLENNYKLYLNISGKIDIINVLRQAIQNADRSKLVRIDLGTNGGWWSMRLHLLAGLLADYTSVQRLVFSDKGEHLGTCGPAETRRALAAFFPKVERAFSVALPDHRSFDPQQDIDGIVSRFSEALDASGGELELKTGVLPHVARTFRGFSEDRLAYDAAQDESERQKAIIGKVDLFVVVEESSGELVIINRVKLACRIAELALSRG